jgi:hypothetical protein
MSSARSCPRRSNRPSIRDLYFVGIECSRDDGRLSMPIAGVGRSTASAVFARAMSPVRLGGCTPQTPASVARPRESTPEVRPAVGKDTATMIRAIESLTCLVLGHPTRHICLRNRQ